MDARTGEDNYNIHCTCSIGAKYRFSGKLFLQYLMKV